MVDEELWKQVPSHEKWEHLSDKAKNFIIRDMVEERRYRANEGRYVTSSEFSGNPADVERYKKIDEMGL